MNPVDSCNCVILKFVKIHVLKSILRRKWNSHFIVHIFTWVWAKLYSDVRYNFVEICFLLSDLSEFQFVCFNLMSDSSEIRKKIFVCSRRCWKCKIFMKIGVVKAVLSLWIHTELHWKENHDILKVKNPSVKCVIRHGLYNLQYYFSRCNVL